MIRWLFGYAVAAVAAAGCAAHPAGQFGTTGYQNPTYSYSVSYAEGTLVLPQGWVLDNFASSPQGLVPRKDMGYVTTVHLDRDGDRVPDGPLRIPAYDLRFVHSAHPGVIWLRTFPYSYHLHEQTLEELARSYVPYMLAAGVEAASIDDRAPGPPQVSVTLRSQDAWMVAGHPAEVLELEETPMAGGALRRARVVLVRPGFMYQLTTQRRETVLFPVLLVAGYSNTPEQFEASAPDFDAFLEQITVQGVAGLTKRSGTAAPTGNEEATAPSAEQESATVSDAPAEKEPPAAGSEEIEGGAEPEAPESESSDSNDATPSAQQKLRLEPADTE